MKFPKRLRYRGQGKVLATIYKRNSITQPFKLYWRIRVDGKPRTRLKDFSTYSEAKKAGEKIVNEIATGKLAATLSPGQTTDALAAFERLQEFYQATGRRVSLLGAVSEWANSATALHPYGKTMPEAVQGYLGSLVTVKRKDLLEAVEDFVKAEAPRTVAPAGERPQLGRGYHKQKAQMLRKFAGMFPGHVVSDLTKGHVAKFMEEIPKTKRRPAVSPKSRNHHRTVLKQFLNWTVRNDFLPINHRLFEADSLRPEQTNGSPTEFYTAKEFRDLLDTAKGEMRAMIAIGGLAGLRTAELLRLDWADVWGIRRHLEVTAGKSKTRQRRLVEICPALAAWLRPYAKFQTGPLWKLGEHRFHKRFGRLCEKAKVKRENNALRHSFVTYHFALNSDENLTAAQAGNSPSMIFSHYVGLATKKEARQWFAVRPKKSENNVVDFPEKAEAV